MGRNKIEIKKIEDKQTRNVTFSKRRQGLFKKAETASKMFGLQIGIITFSPTGGKPFVFSSSNSSSLDSIIDRFMSSSSAGGSSSSSSSSSMLLDLVGNNKRNRSSTEEEEQVFHGDASDDDYVHQTDKNHKRRKTMMMDTTSTIPIPSEEEEEKDDQGFQRDLDFDLQTETDDQELFNEILRGFEMDVATVPVASSSSSPEFLVVGSNDNYYCWPSDAELQEIHHHQYPKNSSNGGFEYNAADHHHDETENSMFLLPPPPMFTTTTTSICDNSISSSSYTNELEEEEEEVGGGDEDDLGLTLEEWERVFSTTPTTSSSPSYMMNIQEEVPTADWPTQEFFEHLLS